MNPDPMDMLVKSYDLPKSCAVFERLGEQGIRIRRALAAEKHKIAAWVRENFAEGWASETEIAFGRQPISCFIAVREGRVVGFACHDATFRNFFGPTGVKLEVRKNGIGTGLLFACLEDMRQQGYGYAIVGGVGPTAFYSKAVGAVLIEGSEPGVSGAASHLRFGILNSDLLKEMIRKWLLPCSSRPEEQKTRS